jgi:hypothetical protein
MLEFKNWMEDQENNFTDDVSTVNHEDEYSLPDEDQMQRIMKNPLNAIHRQDLQGEIFTFKMPMGIEEFKIVTGGRIGLKAKPGSLTAVCMKKLKSKSYKELYDLLLYVKNNNNLMIRNQLIYYKSN